MFIKKVLCKVGIRRAYLNFATIYCLYWYINWSLIALYLLFFVYPVLHSWSSQLELLIKNYLWKLYSYLLLIKSIIVATRQCIKIKKLNNFTFIIYTRQEPSMIYLASPQSRPAVIVAGFWSFVPDDVRMDGQHVWK